MQGQITQVEYSSSSKHRHKTQPNATTTSSSSLRPSVARGSALFVRTMHAPAELAARARPSKHTTREPRRFEKSALVRFCVRGGGRIMSKWHTHTHTQTTKDAASTRNERNTVASARARATI